MQLQWYVQVSFICHAHLLFDVKLKFFLHILCKKDFYTLGIHLDTIIPKDPSYFDATMEVKVCKFRFTLITMIRHQASVLLKSFKGFQMACE